MTQSVNYCETCKWWRENEEYEDIGFCGKSFAPDPKAWSADGLRDNGIECDHDFGCVLWEEKEGA